jgi:3-oxoacyl-[acyl-carrier protein] reductase
MDIALTGRTALVTGGTQGIGLAVAREMASLGARVVVLARDAAKGEAACASLDRPEGQAHGVVIADMADSPALQAAVAGAIASTPVDIVVNNTGGPPPGPAHLAGVEDFERAFRLHLLAYQIVLGQVVPGMKERGHGRIINIISTSVKQPLHGLGVSNTIRGAVANWAKTLANELGPYGITVNNVLPGATETERLADIIKRKAAGAGLSEAHVAAAMRAEVPLRRFALPAEIAWAVAFLAGPSGSYINGINLPVDGGRTACL